MTVLFNTERNDRTERIITESNFPPGKTPCGRDRPTVTSVWSLVVVVAGLATMRAALDRGDIDEAARQGVLAGPVVIEQGLAAPDRPARLAAIAAAPHATDRLELLEALAAVAAGPDRRTALPAARAARAIARDSRSRDLPDDLAAEEVAGWAAQWRALAADRERWIELRVIALDVATTLDPSTTLDFTDPDPAFRRAAIAVVPMPVPVTLRGPLATVVAKDTDPVVALAAAATLCADLAVDQAKPVLDALGPAGLDRIKSLVTSAGPKVQLRDAARCLR
jgi:hypothetical protein